MDTILHYINSIFTQGLWQSGTAIVITMGILIVINYILNTLIKRHCQNNLLFFMRMKKVLIYTLSISAICLQIKVLKSLSTTVLASSGIVAVMIGLASQEAASNIIHGLLVLGYKPYQVGDTISIPDQSVRGKVIDISLRHTTMETMEKTQLIIPNSIMNRTLIENISNIPNKRANYLSITISYQSDVEKAITIIQTLATQHPLSIDARRQEDKLEGGERVPVHCMEFTNTGICLRATIYSKDNAGGFQMLSDLRKQIKREFDAQAIVIPYLHTPSM